MTIFLAEESSTKRIVGAIVFGPNPLAPEHPQSHAIGVVLDRRCEGIGTDLKLAALAELFATGQPSALFSDVHRNNIPMLRLNEKLQAAKEQDPEYPAHFISVVVPTPDASS